MEKKSFKEKIYIAIIFICIISILILAIINYDSIIDTIVKMINIAVPFIYGACFAYLLTPLCNKIENKLNKYRIKYPETLAIVITEVIFITLIIIVAITIVPQSIKSIATIVETIPSTWESFKIAIQNSADSNNLINNIIGENLDELNEFLANFIDNTVVPNINSIIAGVATGVTSIGKTILNIIIGIIINIFVLANRKTFSRQAKLIARAIFNENTYKIILDEVIIADKMFSGFFTGKIVDSIIVGIICFISLTIMGMPYTVLISVIVAITNIVPVVGPFIGAIPGIIIVFSVDPIKSFYFIIFILILQQIDGHIIGPKCIGNATGLSTFWVLFAILFFGGMWGLVGMIIGVPLFAVIYDIIRKVVNYRIEKKAKLNKETY